jgi:hypothetical protein
MADKLQFGVCKKLTPRVDGSAVGLYEVTKTRFKVVDCVAVGWLPTNLSNMLQDEPWIKGRHSGGKDRDTLNSFLLRSSSRMKQAAHQGP